VKLIVGLGNPGRKYEGTRHNVGFDVVDRLATKHNAAWESAPRGIEALIARCRLSRAQSREIPDIVVAKPLTFMNLSGAAIVGLLQFYKIEIPDLLVIVDDVNLELGRLRTRSGGSAGGHNGLKSTIESLGTDEFARLRVGVGRGDARRDLADHVLTKFDRDEREDVDAAVARAADAAELFVTDGIGQVMNRFNRKEDAE
jgi:peptidyl-tRNA hydrolase, PTH1 family